MTTTTHGQLELKSFNCILSRTLGKGCLSSDYRTPRRKATIELLPEFKSVLLYKPVFICLYLHSHRTLFFYTIWLLKNIAFITSYMNTHQQSTAGHRPLPRKEFWAYFTTLVRQSGIK